MSTPTLPPEPEKKASAGSSLANLPPWVRYVAVLLVGLLIGVVVVNASAGDDEDPVASTPVASETQAEQPTETASEVPDEDPVVSESDSPDEFEFDELQFGDVLPVTTDDGSEETNVTVNAPTIAPCSYQGIGCAKPQTGDRIVQVEVVIKNTGDTVATWGSDYFVLEFKDGTQMGHYEGNSIEYGPQAVMDYTIKIRPGSTYRSTLVFEAPNGAFSILILTSDFDGVPFAAWS